MEKGSPVKKTPSEGSQNGSACADVQNGLGVGATATGANGKPKLAHQHSDGKKRIYKVVLTGGPCGGKTTGQDRLATFFENMGWRVYRVPETSTTLLKGGIRFADLSDEQREKFQEDLLMTLMRTEDVYFHLAEGTCVNEEYPRNVLIICDRGTMDGSAYISHETWEKILKRNNLNLIELRDRRYDQIVHLVTAAIGAENFYTQANNVTRSEGAKMAAEVDMKTREVWIGHPYYDVVDNQATRHFEDKILKMIQVVCDRAGIQYGDRLAPNSKKRKFLVNSFTGEFPTFQEFDVEHYYLSMSSDKEEQARIRRRGQNRKFCYTHTVRRIVDGERVETRMQVSQREYEALKKHVDPIRFGTKKKRRCFMYGQMYCQLDIYKPPIPRGMKQLMILETYTTDLSPELIKSLPPFLNVEREITADPQYSLYNLSLKE